MRTDALSEYLEEILMTLTSVRTALRALVTAGVCLIPCTGITPASASTHRASASIKLTEQDYWAFAAISNGINWLINTYHKEHPNVTIARTVIPGDQLVSKFLAESLTNSLPSIAMPDNPAVAALAKGGVLTSISPQVKAWGQWSQYFPASQQATTYKGQIYGIHMGTNDLSIIYNADMLKAAGIAHPPATWSELRADARKLTHGNVYGMAFGVAPGGCGAWQFEPWMWSAGGDLQTPTSAGTVRALTFLTSFIHDGSVSKNVVNWCQTESEAAFLEQRAAMMENGSWNLPDLAKVHNFHWGIVPIPAPEAGAKVVVPVGGEVWAVPHTDAAQQAAAWDFIKWTQQPRILQHYNDMIGYIPVRKDVASQVEKANPLLRVYVDELVTARARTTILGDQYPQYATVLENAIGEALTLKQSPQAALAAAAQKMKAMK